jgi:hypothetical protein
MTEMARMVQKLFCITPFLLLTITGACSETPPCTVSALPLCLRPLFHPLSLRPHPRDV